MKWKTILAAGAILFTGNSIAQQCFPAPDGLVSLWPGDGNTQDIVGENHGTMVGASYVTPGWISDAFSFDGVEGRYVNVPASSTLESQTITVEAWVRSDPPSSGEVTYILSKGAKFCMGTSYAFNTHLGGLTFFVYDGTTGYGYEVKSPNAGVGVWDSNWHHIAGTYDGAFVRLYVDGEEIGDGTPTDVAIAYDLPTHNDLLIGDIKGVCQAAFQGDVDEVSLFNRALTVSEIQAISAAGSAGKCIAPMFTCNGFEPPMTSGPVKAKKNRALPLKAQIFDEGNYAMTDADLVAPPWCKSGMNTAHQPRI